MEDIEQLREDLGTRADQVIDALAKAVKKLDGYEWDDSLPVRKAGWPGDTYTYEFYPGYVVTFRRETDRNERKQPILIHLYLKRVMGA